MPGTPDVLQCINDALCVFQDPLDRVANITAVNICEALLSMLWRLKQVYYNALVSMQTAIQANYRDHVSTNKAFHLNLLFTVLKLLELHLFQRLPTIPKENFSLIYSNLSCVMSRFGINHQHGDFMSMCLCWEIFTCILSQNYSILLMDLTIHQGDDNCYQAQYLKKVWQYTWLVVICTVWLNNIHLITLQIEGEKIQTT